MIFNKISSRASLGYLSILIILTIFCQSSFSLNSELLETDQYSISFYSTNKGSQNAYKAALKIKLKDGWKLFVRENSEEEFLPKVSLKSSSDIKNIEVIWPEPEFDQLKNAYLYSKEVLIPIQVYLDGTDKGPVDFNFSVFLAYCKDVCISNQHEFSVTMPKTDNDSDSYEAIKLIDLGVYNLIGDSFIIVLLISFLGGFILNFMPCVLPVISMKVLAVIKARSSKLAPRYDFIAISLGIITCFLIIGIVFSSFKLAGQHVGLGFNFQYPVFVVSLVLFIMLFASIVNDSIYVDLPSKWKEFLVNHSKEGKLMGSYFSGVFATILSTPCTAPFLGAAISVAMVLSVTKMLVSFSVMGIGMAFPFIILSVFPGAIKFLPSPGPWVAKFKKFLELLLYLTALWLIWIISVQLGVYPAIALFLSCLLFKFFLEKRSSIGFYTKTLLIIIVLVSAYVIPIKTAVLEEKYDERINEIWRPFDLSKVYKFVEDDKVVIVDITAEWCMTCKYNKITVLENPFMLNFFKENKIVALKGDYTNHSENISDFLKSYSRYGIPFTLIFSKKYPKGIILPTILKTSDVINAIKKSKVKRVDWSDRK